MTAITQSGLSVVEKVASRVCHRYTFGCYDSDDIRQEAVIMGMEVWPRWDEQRPWENFVATHISNRLKSLKRDKYFRLGLDDAAPERKQRNETKRNLMEPTEISEDDSYYEEDTFERLCTEEAIDTVLMSLPTHLRNDFQRMANGVTVSKTRRNNVVEAVKEILGEDW